MRLFTRTQLRLLFCVLVLWLVPPGLSASLTDGLYDETFRRYWSRYLPNYDYRWGIAQCYQESLLRPRARSSAGAMGLCQFMPKTFEECRRALRLGRAHPFHPQTSILCNAWYMERQIRIWKSERSELEKLFLAQASYNAGAGNIIKAQKKCDMALLWVNIQPCLHQITGKLSEETTVYILRIKRWFRQLIKELLNET